MSKISKIILLSFALTGIALTVYSQTFKKVNILIAQDSITELESHPYTNEDVHGSFVVDDYKIEPVEIHYRGAYYLKQLIKDGSLRNWKIKTPKDQKFENRREWNFNYEDFIRQNLSYHIYRQAGVPCISTENVILSVNGTKQGLYLKYDDPDNKDWLAETFGSDEGDLYKAAYDLPGEEQQFAALTYLGDKDEDYFLHYRKQTNKKGENEFNYGSIRDFLSLVNHTPDEQFESVIEANFDVDEFIRYLIVTNFTANWDAYPIRPKNFWLYNSPSDKLWHFIPWDLDNTFLEDHSRNPLNTTGTVFFYFDGIEDYQHGDTEPLERPIVWRIMKIERFRNQYIYEYKKAVESYLSEKFLTELIDSIATGVEENTSGTELSSYRNDVSSTRSFITKRLSSVIQELSLYEVENPYVSLAESEMGMMNRLRIYPNPATKFVSIDLPFSDPGRVHFQLVNMMGQELISLKAPYLFPYNNCFKVNLEKIPAGQYIIMLTSENRVLTEKLNIIKP